MRETNETPYVGPRPFERSDIRLFFGREGEKRELLSLVVAGRVVLLYAPSGAGKSSLLRAGLAPLLEEEEGFEVLIARIRTGMPESVLAEAANAYMLGVLLTLAAASADGGAGAVELGRTSLPEFLARRPHGVDRAGLPAPRALVLDQFEELFTFYPQYWRQRRDFVAQIGRALEDDPLLRVVLSLREDFLAHVDSYAEQFPGGGATRFRLERLGREQALSAVVDPVKTTDRRYAPGVAEKLVSDLLRFRMDLGGGRIAEVEGEFVEPVQLQVVCQSLWAGLPPGAEEITEEHLQTFGDPDEVLRRFYDRAVRAAARTARVREGRLREWIESAFITSVGTRSTVYRTDGSTGEIPNVAVEELENRHLIRAEWRAGARWYELTHDRFIHPVQSSNARFRSDRFRIRRRRVLAAVAVLAPLLATVALWRVAGATDAPGSPAPLVPEGGVVAFPLTVSVRGEGTVVSAPPGIDCPETCSRLFEEDARVGLQASPTGEHRFVGWVGACGDTNAQCTVEVAGETSVAAIFTSMLGRSAGGSPIEAVRVGNPSAPHRILVIGCTAGDECKGIPIANTLARSAPEHAEVWVVPNLNPDGLARGARKNASGVSLNRNFPWEWESAPAAPDDENYRGARPLSEPETRFIRDLIELARPTITIWYFARKTREREPGVADAGGSPEIPRTYARLVGLSEELLPGKNPGSGASWQNAASRGTTAFFVELPYPELTPADARRYANAVLELPRALGNGLE